MNVIREKGRFRSYWLGSASITTNRRTVLRKFAALLGQKQRRPQGTFCHSQVGGLRTTWGYGAMTTAIKISHNSRRSLSIGGNLRRRTCIVLHPAWKAKSRKRVAIVCDHALPHGGQCRMICPLPSRVRDVDWSGFSGHLENGVGRQRIHSAHAFGAWNQM